MRFPRTAAVVVSALTLAASAGAVDPPTEKALALARDGATLQWGPCPPIFPTGCQIAVLHGDPAGPNADVFLRVPAKYEIPPHFHTSPERMVLVSGELHVTYRGQPTAILRPGTYAYGPARAPHKATCAGADACVLFIAFQSAVDAQPYDGSLE